jgi:hypothetical protein
MQPSYDMNGYKLVGWIGPEPVRIDVASVRLAHNYLTAHGSSTAADFVLTYRLVTEPPWTTRGLDVRVVGDGWWRELVLRRDDEGRWSSRHTAATGDGEPASTSTEHDDLDGALDCDLALCPLTNTMPVLRHGLLDASRSGAARRVDLMMAWVSVPDLEVVASAQRYDSGVAVAGGGVQIRYQAGSFVEHIEFDADGLVVSYPSIGRRIADHPGSSDASRNAG